MSGLTRRDLFRGAAAVAVLPRAQPAGPLARLLAEEHAAIYLYGVLGPHLPPALEDRARAAYDDHRRHRDTLVAALRRAGVEPPAAEPAYALPGGVGTPRAARAVAETVERSLAIRWRAAVGAVATPDRVLCARALCDEAAHLAVWRYALAHDARAAAATFPGRA